MGGMSSSTLDSASKVAIVETVASSMGLDYSKVKFVGSIATAETSSPTSAPVGLRRRLDDTTIYSIQAITQTTVTSSDSDSTDLTSLYNSLSASLQAAVSGGTFLATLTSISASLNATATASVAALTVEISEPLIVISTYPPTSSPTASPISTSQKAKKFFTFGAIAGVTIGGTAFVGLIAFGLFFTTQYGREWYAKHFPKKYQLKMDLGGNNENQLTHFGTETVEMGVVSMNEAHLGTDVGMDDVYKRGLSPSGTESTVTFTNFWRSSRHLSLMSGFFSAISSPRNSTGTKANEGHTSTPFHPSAPSSPDAEAHISAQTTIIGFGEQDADQKEASAPQMELQVAETNDIQLELELGGDLITFDDFAQGADISSEQLIVQYGEEAQI